MHKEYQPLRFTAQKNPCTSIICFPISRIPFAVTSHFTKHTRIGTEERFSKLIDMNNVSNYKIVVDSSRFCIIMCWERADPRKPTTTQRHELRYELMFTQSRFRREMLTLKQQYMNEMHIFGFYLKFSTS